MLAEILITSVIVVAAVFMLYRNIKKGASGKCTACEYKSSCCSHCTMDSKK